MWSSGSKALGLNPLDLLNYASGKRSFRKRAGAVLVLRTWWEFPCSWDREPASLFTVESPGGKHFSLLTADLTGSVHKTSEWNKFLSWYHLPSPFLFPSPVPFNSVPPYPQTNTLFLRFSINPLENRIANKLYLLISKDSILIWRKSRTSISQRQLVVIVITVILR